MNPTPSLEVAGVTAPHSSETRTVGDSASPHWGPRITKNGSARFCLWAPDLEDLLLEIDGRAPIQMQREEDGWFSVETNADAGTRYRFRISDELAVTDPASRFQSGNVHGWSVLVDPEAHTWHEAAWRGRPWHEAVIYELHPGLLGGFLGIIDRLQELKTLGVTALQMMPLAEFSGARNWGYDGVLPYAPSASYGTPADLVALVDAAHAHGLMIFVDVVYNHFGPEGNYLGAYASEFFDAGIETPWGAAVAVKRAPVAGYFIDNALMWLIDYRMDGLRFDAVHAIGNDAFLDAMAQKIRAKIGSERQIHLILENEGNDSERLSGDFDAQWNDDFHNVMHVLLTGETISYYADFAEQPIEKLARSLVDGFIYQGDPSPNHNGIPRGKPSAHLPPTAFVNFLQNHDQVGNRALGERLTRLVDKPKLRAAVALTLLAPMVPMLFMGEEVGSTTPFLFFTDFRDALADAVREGRRREFSGFPAFTDPAARATIPDPNAPDTYVHSSPLPGPDAAEWRDLYTELLRLRHAHIVPHLEGTAAIGADVVGPKAIQASWRLANGDRLVILVNLADEAVEKQVPSETAPFFSTGDPSQGPGFSAWLEHA